MTLAALISSARTVFGVAAVVAASANGSGPGPKKKRVLLHVSGTGTAWIKITYVDQSVTGFEFYDVRPPPEYWRDCYGHSEPDLIHVSEPMHLMLAPAHGEGNILAIWPSLYGGVGCGVEVVHTRPKRGQLLKLPRA